MLTAPAAAKRQKRITDRLEPQAGALLHSIDQLNRKKMGRVRPQDRTGHRGNGVSISPSPAAKHSPSRGRCANSRTITSAQGTDSADSTDVPT